jgi:hypothetical protein
MAERNSWAVSDSPNGVISTEDARLSLSAAIQSGPDPVRSRNGIRPALGDPGRVAAVAPTPNKTVAVQPFQMFTRPRRGVGSYVQTLDSVKVLDLITGTPAMKPNESRIDLIVAQQSDKFYGDNENRFAIVHVVGTSAITPVVPEVPGLGDYLPLAQVTIAATDTVITDKMIRDARPGWVVGLGGVSPMRGSGERDATHAYNGLTGYRQDRRWLETYDGEKWRVPSAPIVNSTADLASITNPHLGQLVVNTEDALVYRWDGAAWVGAVPTGTVRHEARYEIRFRQGQSMPAADTNVRFPTAVYTSPDVSVSANSAVFTLNRAGLWSITVGQRIAGSMGNGTYEMYLGIVNADDWAVRYAHVQHLYAIGMSSSLNCSTENVFPAGTKISAIVWHTQPLGMSHEVVWQNVNNISLTWLRP